MAAARSELEVHAFDVVGSLLPALLPAQLGPWHVRTHRWGAKVWQGSADEVAREHWEAQVVGARHVPAAKHLAIEVGFHAEHPKEPLNEAVAVALGTAERRWRKVLGPDARLRPFLGQPRWRRLSETWLDPDLGDLELPFELTARLADYVTAVAPLRAGR